MWSKLSLRIRITIFTTLVIVTTSGFLTLVLVNNAKKSLSEPISNMTNNEGGLSTYTTKSFSDQLTISTQNYILQSVAFMFVVIVLGVIITWFVSKRALKPISDLSKTIENIDVNNLSQTIPIPKSNDEVSKLTQSFNNLLHKINTSYEVQKRFAQNAAHELKTPLSVILTNIEVLELDEHPSIEEYKDVINITKEQVERMSTLVKDLMMLNTNYNEQYSKFKFSELDVLSTLSYEINNKNITVTVEGDIEMIGNRVLIERALYNIIHNAIRYNHEHGNIVIVCKDDSICITDTGIGIPCDQLDKIFEPFYCVDVSRSKTLGGSGLGLAIVKQILDHHGIKVEVDSVVNKGTTFKIKFKS